MIRTNPNQSLKPIKGSRAPGIGYLYIALIMFVTLAAGTLLSGGFIPVDPNGVNGPPTLPPYWSENGVDEQRILFATSAPDEKPNLQLKTFKVNVCGSNTVIDFLIDISASMKYDNKIGKVKKGLYEFVRKMSPSAVVGMQTFASNVQNRVPLDHLKKNRQSMMSNIAALNPEGWTRLRDGFQLAKGEIVQAVTKDKFPGYKYYLVLISDGVPETPGGPNYPPRTCLNPPGNVPEPLLPPDNVRCFTTQQDPRTPTNLAKDLQTIGVEVYTIGILGASQPSSDAPMRPYLEALLKDVTSPPLEGHYFVANAQSIDVQNTLKSLASFLCEEIIGGGEPLAGTPSPTPRFYPFPTYPDNATHVPYTPPGGKMDWLAPTTQKDNQKAPITPMIPQ